MAVTLPTNPNGSLRAFTDTEVIAMNLRRRGIKAEHDHITTMLGPDGSYCTRRFSCDWDQRYNAAVHLVGASKLYDDTGVTKLSRLMPQRDPVFNNWACTKVEIAPFRFMQNTVEAEDPEDPDSIEDVNPGYKAGVHVPEFWRAELKATFEMCPFGFKSDADTESETERYTTKPGAVPGGAVSGEPSYISLPGGASGQVYSTDTGTGKPAGVPIPYGIGFIEPQRKFRIVWRRLPFDAWGPGKPLFNRVIGNEGSRGFFGAVNKTYFLGYWSLTLQLVGVEETLLPDPTGLGYSWDLAYTFVHKPVPFGHLGFYFFDPATTGNVSGYYQTQRAGLNTRITDETLITDGSALFPVREFEDLFKVGAA
ncbi:hypothetical protein GobsT_71300 [Gemmata obscuriglobus]|uniref:Uncharacterized protein n=1 Tax=Gemmata obscuriglobus TaxID=114 RepID=A0A2Z3HDU5_9BACT|nr:hypothetical protein [Gemmata obscuriglobus]AWM41767.1 hypothetical protein C1280_35405 [Gemmata obscuriglobus]QEG32277.1 hypothetical protein GobsT_71300 [Gemmata obscuriglobus]VTS11633.1 unnamed protein product [Gemmata obscuriglobus UQM 2246]